MAKLKDALVCTTISSEAKAHQAGMLGADHCVYYNRMNFVDGVQPLDPGPGGRCGFGHGGRADPVSKPFRRCASTGNVVTLHSALPETDWNTARQRNLRVSFALTLTPRLQHQREGLLYQARILKQCAKWLDAGKVKVLLSKTFPLAAVGEAYDYLGTHPTGKVVLSLRD